MARVRFFVAGLTSGLSLNARDTVDFATFASRAMSSIEVSWDLLAGITVPRPPGAVLTPWPFKRAGAGYIPMANKVWFITGTSKGFGRVWAEAALARGDRVAATARNAKTLAPLVERYGERTAAITLDVTDKTAVHAAVS